MRMTRSNGWKARPTVDEIIAEWFAARRKHDDEAVTYRIDEVPVSISFDCPNCEYRVSVPFGDVDDGSGEIWSGWAGCVECPDCGEEVRLGEVDYG